jgi:DNA-binding NarL/FixJ family response regulator
VDLRLFVVEPQSLRRRIVRESLAQATGLTVAGESASLAEAQIGETEPPDILLVDSGLITSEHGELARVSRRFPQTSIVLFGTHPDLEALLGAVQLPIRGFLAFNHLTSDEFRRSLEVIAYGGAVIEPISAQLLLEYLRARALPAMTSAGQPVELTEREEQVLELVRRGLSNKEIALALDISLGTVRAHLRTIFRKLDVSSRAGAAAATTVVLRRADDGPAMVRPA